MKYTKEELDALRNDPLMQFISSLFGTNLNDVVDGAKKELEEEENKNKINQKTNDILNAFKEKKSEHSDKNENVKSRLEETLRKMEKDGLIHNLCINNQPVQDKKREYEAPKCEVKSFIMSKEQFVKFINNYIELINNVAKSRYLFGVSFDNADCRYNIAEAIRGIIWDFVRLIFGDDNADDIADFVYGNSNFDSPEKLYDELV
jgi:hypothetical protein